MVDPHGNSDVKAPRASGLSAADIALYLRRHPDFLVEHPDLLSVLTPPAHRRGDNVVDMQHFMVERLKSDVHRLRAQQRALIATSRSNLSSQQRIHAGVLALLSAASFEQLIQTVTTDLAILLDIDVVTLCVESRDGFGSTPRSGLQLLPPGEIDTLLEPHKDAVLLDQVDGDPAVFGAGAGLVRSAALLRLAIPGAPPGLLALGTRRAGRFKPGQGTELLSFLSQSLGVIIGQWLDL
jgi:uncharacterized protein